MKLKKVILTCVAASFLSFANFSWANSDKADMGAIVLKLGDYDARRWAQIDGNAKPSGMLGLEYIDKSRFIFDIKPIFGFLTNDSSDLFAYAGILKDVQLTDKYSMQFSFAPGYYEHNGGRDTIDLDCNLEFKSEIGFSYQLPIGDKVGLALSHLSNAKIGDENPGTEIITINYTIPFNSF